MKPIKHKIIKVTDKIFALEIANDWDRAMTFLRAQEFYESPSSKFKGKSFDIWDYMKWYACERSDANGSFSYPYDWAAYNLPIKVIVECLDAQKTKTTPYDDFMDEVLHQIFNKYGVAEHDTYLIGVDKMEGRNLRHEMSHALWYTNPEYKKRANEILKQIDKEHLEVAKNKIHLMGYAKSVLMDEIFAYSSTGEMQRLFGKHGETVAAQYQQACMDLLEEFLPKSQKLKIAA